MNIKKRDSYIEFITINQKEPNKKGSDIILTACERIINTLKEEENKDYKLLSCVLESSSEEEFLSDALKSRLTFKLTFKQI